MRNLTKLQSPLKLPEICWCQHQAKKEDYSSIWCHRGKPLGKRRKKITQKLKVPALFLLFNEQSHFHFNRSLFLHKFDSQRSMFVGQLGFSSIFGCTPFTFNYPKMSKNMATRFLHKPWLTLLQWTFRNCCE